VGRIREGDAFEQDSSVSERIHEKMESFFRFLLILGITFDTLKNNNFNYFKFNTKVGKGLSESSIPNKFQ